jgi:hypothetical protein
MKTNPMFPQRYYTPAGRYQSRITLRLIFFLLVTSIQINGQKLAVHTDHKIRRQQRQSPSIIVRMHGIYNQRPSANATIIATLLIVRFAFLVFSQAGMSGDAFSYVQAAQTIIDTGKLPPLYVQPSGYPLLVAPLLFFSGPEIGRVVLFMNSMMDCAVVAILLYCTKKIFPYSDQRSARFLCWLLVIIQPFTAVMVNSAYTETPVMFFNFVGMWLLFTSRRFIWTACGLGLLGVASLLRIDVLPLNAVSVAISFIIFGGAKGDTRVGVKGFLVYLAFPGLMLIYQFYSTQQIGFVRYDPWNGAVLNVVGIRCGAISGNMKVSFQAARSIG